ncbi:MAG: hypothetical protein OHM77_01590 [Candidatus Nitricoxidivorans perseverans]|uniref:Lipoprotein n=1 Tax=Candidatus Nitricoxidivorans perseverans TaxID=2975601 RepID=A0AA49FL51_9PROT|nr:MAG: hypothetical protein OHM77_01590 [Candidatus Nitricoxidivorans perseverans]
MNRQLLLLIAVPMLSACVNLHVHFPEAPAEKPAAEAPAQPEK